MGAPTFAISSAKTRKKTNTKTRKKTIRQVERQGKRQSHLHNYQCLVLLAVCALVLASCRREAGSWLGPTNCPLDWDQSCPTCSIDKLKDKVKAKQKDKDKQKRRTYKKTTKTSKLVNHLTPIRRTYFCQQGSEI